MAENVKEGMQNMKDKITGNYTAEDKAANKVKGAADTCADKVTPSLNIAQTYRLQAGECRDKMSDKMHQAGRTLEGH